MKNTSIAIIVIILLLVAASSYFILNPNNQSQEDNQAINNNFKTNNTDKTITNTNKDNEESITDTTEERGSPESDSDTGYESGSGEDGGTTPGGGRSETPNCLLIRPGGVPGVKCSVNHITTNQVSIKLKSELEQDIDVIIDLETCTPQQTSEIPSHQEKDFIFSCQNQEYFDQGITINHFLQGGQIKVNGFVFGPVS